MFQGILDQAQIEGTRTVTKEEDDQFNGVFEQKKLISLNFVKFFSQQMVHHYEGQKLNL